MVVVLSFWWVVSRIAAQLLTAYAAVCSRRLVFSRFRIGSRSDSRSCVYLAGGPFLRSSRRPSVPHGSAFSIGLAVYLFFGLFRPDLGLYRRRRFLSRSRISSRFSLLRFARLFIRFSRFFFSVAWALVFVRRLDGRPACPC